MIAATSCSTRWVTVTSCALQTAKSQQINHFTVLVTCQTVEPGFLRLCIPEQPFRTRKPGRNSSASSGIATLKRLSARVTS